MQLLDHVSIAVPDLANARLFYDAIMAALGVAKIYDTDEAIGYGQRCSATDDAHSYLSIYRSSTASADPGRHWCFKAGSREAVAAFHTAGLAAGGLDDGLPGLRPQYHAGYFAAFLRDPCGNRIEAVCHCSE